ncbi:MAG: MMPL family transporter [Flavobacteriales bacterium]|nr:MMPL family transporter [Flavobacteriales bacterium]MBK7556497.1 MMPL family transporter [Flavobacteriales bacterium]MBK9193778.1 MMPL family transporter [Flavobacteriales bacterium]MBP6574025.1 MMPL family transporter [Flavobacteriales bacterium]
MWTWLAGKILRNRITVLVITGVLTVLMGYQATKVKMSYRHGGLLPKTDSVYLAYHEFTEQFSEDGNVMVLGTGDPKLYTPERFKAWWQLGNDLKEIPGVDSVFSEAHLFDLVRDDSLTTFKLRSVVVSPPTTQAEMDSLKARIRSLPFYDKLLFNDSTGASLMMLFLDAAMFNSEQRGDMIERIVARGEEFAAGGSEVHYSGLPYVRVMLTSLVKGEMPLFMGLSLLVCAILLLIFFRSWRVMWICVLVVAISVVWSFGILGLLDYRITLIMSVISPLVIVTGVPNCVFLINSYQIEFVRHGNKMKALQRVITRVGAAAFMTNATTAVGFTTFMLTYSDSLREFGLVATAGIMVLWALSMVLIPILFSFMPPPTAKHLRHLDRRWMDVVVDRIVRISHRRRALVYALTVLVFSIALLGMTRLKDESRVVDDLPEHNPVLVHMRWFEKNYHGVIPLEVIIDSKKNGGALKDATLKRIERFCDTLATYPEFSRPISIVDAVKFTKQAFYGGNPEKYALLTGPEKSFILPYLQGAGEKKSMGKAFLDTARQVTRLTVQMADIGTTRMDALMERLRPQVDSIFDPTKYDVRFTGNSVVFLKGNSYLVDNLITSLGWAIALIVVLMALLFGSLRILVVSLIPNLIPLVVTAGLMGIFHIPIKPSTILVFGIALGIAVDNAIHFLARYRLELKLTNNDIKRSVDLATREVSVGIIYTSAVLFFGFTIFAFSEFGGIQALGILTSITLLVAMFTNLLVLPALLLSFHRNLITQAFREPLLVILDEDDDVDLGELKLENSDEQEQLK